MPAFSRCTVSICGEKFAAKSVGGELLLGGELYYRPGPDPRLRPRVEEPAIIALLRVPYVKQATASLQTLQKGDEIAKLVCIEHMCRPVTLTGIVLAEDFLYGRRLAVMEIGCSSA